MEASEGDPVVVKACEAYAGPLYSYCLWLLADEQRAIAALVELFVGAQRLDVRLSDPRLSRWLLYAILRPGCLRESGEQDRSWPADVADTFAWTDGVDWEQREILELSVRHGLDEQDVALVLGVSGDDVRARLAGARAALEAARTVSTLMPSDCDELTEQLAVSSPSESRTVVQEHAAQCLACGERLHNAAPIPTRLAHVPTPPELRPRILHALAASYPELAEPVAKALGEDTPATPEPQQPPSQPQPQPVRQRRRLAVMTTALVIIPFGVGALLLTGGGNAEHPSSQPIATGTAAGGAGASAASTQSGSTASSLSVVSEHGASPSRSGATTYPTTRSSAKTVPGVPSSSPASSTAAGSTPSPVSSSTPSPAGSSDPALGVTWTQDQRQTTTITLTATGGSPVQWSVSVSDDYLSVSQPSGELWPGQSQSVTVTVDPSLAPKPPWHAKIFVDPGHTVIPVSSGKSPA